MKILIILFLGLLWVWVFYCFLNWIYGEWLSNRLKHLKHIFHRDNVDIAIGGGRLFCF